MKMAKNHAQKIEQEFADKIKTLGKLTVKLLKLK